MQFINANLEWAQSNIGTLIDNNLVDDSYLIGTAGIDNSYPVTNVSWHAANAYCEWMTQTLPAAYGGYECRLPREE